MIGADLDDRPPASHGIGQTHVAVVLAHPTSQVILIGSDVGVHGPPRPGKPKEPAAPIHLVAPIDADRVMVFGVRQRVIPGRGGVVAVGSGVQGDVLTAPPEVHVQQVGLGRPVPEVRRARQCKTALRAESEVAAVGSGEIAPRRRFDGRGQRFGAVKPQQALVPGAFAKTAAPLGQKTRCLDDGAEVAVAAIVERKNQGAVVLSATRDCAGQLVLLLVEELAGGADAAVQLGGEWPAVQFAQPRRP